MSDFMTDRAKRLLGLLVATLVLSTIRQLPAVESDAGFRADADPGKVALRIVREEPTIKAAIGSFTSQTQTLAVEVVDAVVAARLPEYQRASFQFMVQGDKEDAKSVIGIRPLTKEQEGQAYWVMAADGKFVLVKIKTVKPSTHSDLVKGASASIEFEWLRPQASDAK